jgi:putative ABC transport system substrate-binding protein
MAVLTDVNCTKFVKLEALQEAARAHNIEFSIHRVAKGEEIAATIDGAQASGARALNIVSSPLFYAYRHLIVDRAVAARLPTIYEFPEKAEEGGFAAYGPRLSQLLLEIMPPTGRPTLPRQQSSRHPGRTADQVRAGYQPQDR